MSSLKKESSNAFLEYADHIMIIILKEGADLSVESMKEQHQMQESLVGDELFGVLVDGANNVHVPGETREYMANYQPSNRVGTAVLCEHNLATLLIANFYLKVNNPKVPTKIFKSKDKAIEWLRSKLAGE